MCNGPNSDTNAEQVPLAWLTVLYKDFQRTNKHLGIAMLCGCGETPWRSI